MLFWTPEHARYFKSQTFWKVSSDESANGNVQTEHGHICQSRFPNPWTNYETWYQNKRTFNMEAKLTSEVSHNPDISWTKTKSNNLYYFGKPWKLGGSLGDLVGLRQLVCVNIRTERWPNKLHIRLLTYTFIMYYVELHILKAFRKPFRKSCRKAFRKTLCKAFAHQPNARSL